MIDHRMSQPHHNDTELHADHVINDNRVVDARIGELVVESERAVLNNDLRSSQELERAITLLHRRKQQNQILLDGLCRHHWSESYYGQRKCEHCETIKTN